MEKNFDELNNGNPCDCTLEDHFEMSDFANVLGGKVDFSCGPSGEKCTTLGPGGFPFHTTELPFIAGECVRTYYIHPPG